MAPTYEPKAKRRKLEKNETKSESAIKSAQDLHDLLRFKQSSSPDVKNGKPTLAIHVHTDSYSQAFRNSRTSSPILPKSKMALIVSANFRS
jgi:hypothetical protein